MPITTSAKKKLRQDARRQKRNQKSKNAALNAVKKFKKSKSAKLMNEAFSAIDTALKKNLMHKNKAARMKSALAKMLGKKSTPPEKKDIPKKKISRKTSK